MQKIALATITTASLLFVITLPARAFPPIGAALKRPDVAVSLTTPVPGYRCKRGYGHERQWHFGYTHWYHNWTHHGGSQHGLSAESPCIGVDIAGPAG
jgi:hypothetical protein